MTTPTKIIVPVIVTGDSPEDLIDAMDVQLKDVDPKDLIDIKYQVAVCGNGPEYSTLIIYKNKEE